MIYTLTINPAIDKIVFLEKFVKNKTNRPTKMIETIGGKGTHVSVNLNLLKLDNRAILVISGTTGEKLVKMLNDTGVHTEVIRDSGFETRTNIIIVEMTNDCTIIAERGSFITDKVLNRILVMLRKTIRSGDYLVLSGDASNSTRNLYSEIIHEFSPCGIRIFLDTSGELLKQKSSGWTLFSKAQSG